MDVLELYNNIKSNFSPFNVVTTLIGLGGFIASAMSIWYSKKHRCPKYMVRNSNIIGETTLDTNYIDIHYQNTSLPVLSVSKIAFWNSGRVTLNSSDIASKDLMRIEVANDEVRILDFKILYEDKCNGVALTLSDDKKSIQINFDYFAYHQGFVIKLFHTGKFAQDLLVKGSVKDGRTAKRIDNVYGFEEEDVKKDGNLKIVNRSFQLKRILGWIYIVSGLFIIGWRITHWNVVSSVPSETNKFIFIIVGVVTIGIGYLFARRPLPRKLAKVFYEE